MDDNELYDGLNEEERRELSLAVKKLDNISKQHGITC